MFVRNRWFGVRLASKEVDIFGTPSQAPNNRDVAPATDLTSTESLKGRVDACRLGSSAIPAVGGNQFRNSFKSVIG